MPQNGIHAMVGVASRKWMPKREWLLLGVVLGNMFPDLDALVVAYATLAKLPDPAHFHRTFTHSVFTILAVMILFNIIAVLTKNEKWKNFGLGFGIGILMHILLDLVLWFNGVELFWPLGGELNFWAWFQKPVWVSILLDTAEFLMFGLYFLVLVSLSRKNNMDVNRQQSTKIWAYIELTLFVIFTALFFNSNAQGFNYAKGLYYLIYGGLYIVSLVVGMAITTKMKQTVETL